MDVLARFVSELVYAEIVNRAKPANGCVSDILFLLSEATYGNRGVRLDGREQSACRIIDFLKVAKPYRPTHATIHVRSELQGGQNFTGYGFQHLVVFRLFAKYPFDFTQVSVNKLAVACQLYFELRQAGVYILLFV